MKGGETLKLVHKFKPNLSHKEQQILNELTFHTTKFYNIINYAIQENDKVNPVYTKLDKKFKSNWHCNFLMAHNRQHLIKQLAQNWKAYFSSLKDYEENPDKYNGKPKPPGFKNLNNRPNDIIFTNEVARVKGEHGNKLVLSLQKSVKDKYKVKNIKFELPEVIQSLIHSETAKKPKGHTVKNRLQQVKVKQDNLSNEWCFYIIYKTKNKKQPKKNSNTMAIDLGLNNLATIAFEKNTDSYIINGKPLKSKNKYYNERIRHLQSIRMKQTGSKHFKETKQIKYLRIKRRDYVNNYLHQASRRVIDLAQKNSVNKIVIGDLKNIKQGMNYNKDFVQIPIQKFKELIEYKAKLAGIGVILINEAYTSGCSALDQEPLNEANYDKSRRVHRGLFINTAHIKINADLNGALNILRKFLKNSIPKSIIRMTGKGAVNHPRRISVT